MKRTRWFYDVKPVHVGWYETYKNFPELARRRYWDGEYWRFKDEPMPHWQQHWTWRGLAEKPE